MFDSLAKKLFLIGIGGISMSALADILISRGHEVSGSDIAMSKITEKLCDKGIKIFEGHSSSNIGDAECVVYTAAISPQNPEFLYAKQNNIPLLSRAQVLGIISKHFNKTVAVSGTHGKTTTTAMISSVLIDAGLDPTVHLGGEHKKINGNVRIGSTSNLFVTEACEYVDSFLEIHSEVSVILNMQPDHLDYFKNFDNEIKSFKKFSKNTSSEGIVILNIDDENADNLKDSHKNIITYSCKAAADYEARRITCSRKGQYSFDCFEFGRFLGRFHLGILGKHNVYNAMAAIVVARQFKVDYFSLSRSLYEFMGVGRRFEIVGEINGVEIINDYAHHPTEIKSSLSVARDVAEGRVICVFQPHTFTRTHAFFDGFVSSLKVADLVIMYPIYPAREEPIEGISSLELSNRINNSGGKSIYAESFDECFKIIEENAKSGDVVIILGAGNIVDLCKLFSKKIVD